MAPFPPDAAVLLELPASELLRLQESTAFRTLLAQVMDREEEVVDVWHEGDVRYERVLNRPDYEKWVPAIGRRYVKPKDIEFIDIIEYAPRQMQASPYRMRIQTKLPSAGDRVKIDRTIVIEETGSGQCRYRITGNVKVKMFGIGHLVEKQVMANSVDSLSMLAEVVQRFERVHGSLHRKTAGAGGAGTGADMDQDDGPPEDFDDMGFVSSVLQEPYAEGPQRPESDDDNDESELSNDDDEGSSSSGSSSSDDTRFGPEASGGSSASLGCSPPGSLPEATGRPLLRQGTVYHDAEERLGMEAAPTADVDPATAAAMQRDMRRVDTRLARRGRPEPGTPVDHVHVGTRERRRRRRAERAARAAGEEPGNGAASGAGADAGAGGRHRHRRHRHRDRVRTEEDSRRVQRWRRDKERWQRFWAKAVVRDVPASRRTGRLVRLANLLHLGEAVGWLKIHAHRDHRHGDSASEPADAPKEANGSSTRRGFRQSVKDKWHDLSCHGKSKDGGAAMETVNPAAAGKE